MKSVELEPSELLVVAQVVLDDVLHDDAVEGDVPAGEQPLVEQLLPHEVHEYVLAFGLQLRKYAFVGRLSNAAYLLDVLLYRLQIIVPLLLFPRVLLRPRLLPPLGAALLLHYRAAIDALPPLGLQHSPGGLHPFLGVPGRGRPGRGIGLAYVPPDVPHPDLLLLKLGEVVPEVVGQEGLPVDFEVLFETVLQLPQLFGGKGDGLAKSVHLVVQEDEKVVLESPERVLQILAGKDLVDEDLAHVPDFYPAVDGPGDEQAQVVAVVDREEVALVVDGLPVEDHPRLLPVLLKEADLEDASRLDQHQVLLPAPHIQVQLPQEDRPQAVCPPLLEVYQLHKTLLADGDEPLAAGLGVDGLLQVDYLLAVVADPAVNVGEIVDGEEYDGPPRAPHRQQFQLPV